MIDRYSESNQTKFSSDIDTTVRCGLVSSEEGIVKYVDFFEEQCIREKSRREQEDVFR